MWHDTASEEGCSKSHSPCCVPAHTFPCGYSLVQFWGTLVSFLEAKCSCEHAVQWACLKTPPRLRVTEKNIMSGYHMGHGMKEAKLFPQQCMSSWPELQSSSESHRGEETWAGILSPWLWPQAMTLGSGPLKAVFWNINIQIGFFLSRYKFFLEWLLCSFIICTWTMQGICLGSVKICFP